MTSINPPNPPHWPAPPPYDQSSIGVVATGGVAKIPQQWKEAEFTCRITGPDGWINLDDHEHYIVAAESFAGSSMQWRRNQVQSPYVAGKFTVSAVADQVTENVTVYVLGESQAQLQINLADLIDAVSQVAFELTWSADNTSYTWSCDSADYTIDFVNANLFARQLVVKLQIPRNPVIVMGAY